jgi:hypothetical protein
MADSSADPRYGGQRACAGAAGSPSGYGFQIMRMTTTTSSSDAMPLLAAMAP